MGSSKFEITISGRADPKDIALAAQFIIKGNQQKITRSDLVSYCFDIVAQLARSAGGFKDPEFNEDAFNILSLLDISWKGERFEREQKRALQEDAFADLTVDQAAELRDYVKNMKKRDSKKSLKKATTQTEASVSDADLLESLRQAERGEIDERL